jgi:two-component system chemotaxis sensor kinase CheA
MTVADGSVMRAANVRIELAYRFAPIVGAVLIVIGLVFAVFRGWPGIVIGVVGAAVSGYTLYRASVTARRSHEDAAAELERQNRDLWQHARSLEAAKRESEAVLSAVRAHLMLIDGTFRIQSRYSSELEGVFHQRDLGNENFVNVLQRILSERMFKTARDYLALLFDSTRKERVVLKVNPLDEVEVTSNEADGVVGVRYLNFDFRRIVEDGAVSRVLVAVEDITDRVVRERQLRESEQHKVKQFELLIGILHVDPLSLDTFVAMANDQLGIIDQALRAGDFAAATIGQTALLRQRLDVVMARIHNIKGNASLLRLDHFEKMANDFEQKIIDLKHRAALGGDDFLMVVIGLAAFRSDLDDLQSLRLKLAGIQRGAEIHREVGDELLENVRKLAADLAEKLGKSVKIDADGFDSRVLPPAQRLVVKDVLIQLTRNSMAHGIESPIEREAAKKSRVATIEIHPMATQMPGSFAFSFRDDGRGLDAEKIRARAISAGLLEADRADLADDSEIAGFIFAPGFSTADEATSIAGRGVGMNVVKERVVDDCGGEIGVDSQAGRFCEFTFVLPTEHAALASVGGSR